MAMLSETAAPWGLEEHLGQQGVGATGREGPPSRSAEGPGPLRVGEDLQPRPAIRTDRQTWGCSLTSVLRMSAF